MLRCEPAPRVIVASCVRADNFIFCIHLNGIAIRGLRRKTRIKEIENSALDLVDKRVNTSCVQKIAIPVIVVG
jgi:hypothetical protein